MRFVVVNLVAIRASSHVVQPAPMPRRERYLWVCVNERPPQSPKGCCSSKGGKELHRRLKAGLIQRGLHRRYRVCESSCLDLCAQGAAIAVMPDDALLGGLGPDDAEAILDALEAGTTPAQGRLGDTDFGDPERPTGNKTTDDGTTRGSKR